MEAATFYVDNTLDLADDLPGDGNCAATIDLPDPFDDLVMCTLRAAVQEARASLGDDEIVLNGTTYQLTLTGAGEDAGATGDLDVNAAIDSGSLVITGAGPEFTIVDGGGLDRVFHVNNVVLTIRGVTITGGNSPDAGGGILVETASLIAEDLVVFNNQAPSSAGGGIDNFGGTVSLTRVSLVANSASCGAGLDNFGAASLTNVTISGNAASCSGGGIFDGGPSTTIVNNSTLAFNLPNNIDGTDASLRLSNTLLVANSGDTNCVIFGTDPGAIDVGGNYAGGADCGNITVSTGADLIGGLTTVANGQQVRLPQAGNPAIGGGLNLSCASDDQRGFARPEGTVCDSGAVEIISVSLPSANPPPALWNTDYFYTFAATGEFPLNFAITDGTLQAGLALDAGGTISGSSTVTGTENITVTVTDGAGQTASVPTSLTVLNTPATLSGIPPNATWNQPYVFQFTGTGNGELSFALTDGSLPPGMTFESNGTIVGTSAVLGQASFTVTLTDQTLQTVSVVKTLTVGGTAASISGTPPAAPWNQPYSFAFTSTGNGARSLSITNGALPAGLSMSTAGVISGTTTVLGPASFTVTLNDESGQTSSLTTTLEVTGTAASVTGTPTGATWNAPYNFAFTGAGNGTLTFTVPPGTLPAGLAMSSAGVVSGTPTGVGTTSFTVTVSDETSQTDTLDTSITVTGTAASVTGTPTGATWNAPYNFAFTGTGNGTLTFTVPPGTLPAGLSMSSAGVVSGTPTGVGTTPFTVTVTDETSQTSTLNTSIIVTGTAASVTGTPTGATWNAPYNFAFTGTGNGTLTFTVPPGTLPAGLSMSSAGVVSGTPTGVGTSSFTVTVTDVTSQTATLNTSITVNGTTASVTGTPSAATWNSAYSFAFSGTGNGTLTYTITVGALPAGLSMSTAGVVSGTPTGLGQSNFTVTVSDQTAQSAINATSITVTGTAIAISGTPTGATWNAAYDFAFSGTGNGTLTYAITAGALPAGLSMSSAGVVSGTPTGLGQSDFTVTVTDQTAQTATHATSITVTGTAIGIAGTPPAASWNIPYNFAFSGIGNGTLSFAITAGALPAGLTLSTTGVVSGTTTVLGTASFSVTVTDGTSQTSTLATSMTVTGTGISISGMPPQPILNAPYLFAFTATGNGTLTFSLIAGALPSGLTLTPGGALSGAPTASGSYVITVRVMDATAQSAATTVTLFVQDTSSPPPPPANTAPTIAGLNDLTIEENRAIAPIAITLADDATSPDQIQVTVVPGDATILGNVSLTGTGANRTLQITLAEDREGLASLTLTASDGTLSTTATMRLTVTPAPVPNPPTNLTAVVDGNAALFSWRAPVTGAVPTFYVLEGGNQSGAVNFPVVNTGRATSFRTVVPAGTWFFRVRSGNSAGTSVPSAEIAGTVGPGVMIPGAPHGFVTSVEGTMARLAWQPPVDGGPVTTWQIELGSARGLSDRGVFQVPAGTSAVQSSLAAGEYVARVRGINGAGEGPASNEASFMVGAVAPCALGVGDPPVLFPATVANRLVTLGWRPPTNSPVTGYRLLVGSAPGLANLITFDLGPVTSFAAVAPPGQYYVALVARNGCGDSLPSNTILVSVP